MTASEKIQLAEGKVSSLQNHLSTVEAVLDKAETVAVTSEKSGRKARKLFKLLLLVGLAAVIVIIVKNVIARNQADSIESIEAEFVSESTPPPTAADAAQSDEPSDEETETDEDSSDDAASDES